MRSVRVSVARRWPLFSRYPSRQSSRCSLSQMLAKHPTTGIPSAHDNPPAHRPTPWTQGARAFKPSAACSARLVQLLAVPGDATSIMPGFSSPCSRGNSSPGILFCQHIQLTARRNSCASTAPHDPNGLLIGIYHCQAETLGLCGIPTRDMVSAGFAQRNGHTPLSHWMLGCEQARRSRAATGRFL